MFKVVKEMTTSSDMHISQEYGKKKFNNIRIPKRSRMGVCSTCASLKERRDRSEGIERGMFTKQKK